LNIVKFLMGKPVAVILKQQQSLRAAHGSTWQTPTTARTAPTDRAFGGCLVLNRPVDKATAELISENYLEVVAAPDFEEGSLALLKKRANLRIIQVSRMDRLADHIEKRFVTSVAYRRRPHRAAVAP